MHPVLWRWRGHEVRSLPVLLGLGLFLGILAGFSRARASGLPPLSVWLATLLLLPIALLGTRLAYLLADRRGEARAWRRAGSGSFQYGALLALPFSVPVSAALGLPFGRFADVLVFTALVSVVFGRLGCLLAGCCGGRATSSCFGVLLADAAGVRRRRFPTQLIEAAYAAALLAGAAALHGAMPSAGALALAVAVAYAAGRLFLAYLREDQKPGPVGLTGTQAISVLILVSALVGLGALAAG